jgi:hypothetical protein
MHPDLGVHAGELAVERLGEEFEIGVGALFLLRAHVMRRLFDLDQRAAGAAMSRSSAFMMSHRSSIISLSSL